MTELKNSNIPYFSISKEVLKLIIDLLEGEEISIIFNALDNYLYNGEEPNFETKTLKSVWNNMLMFMERSSKSYFTRKKQMDNINNKKKQSQEVENKAINLQDDTNIPQEEENAPERLKMPINEEFENTIEEPQIKEEYMGNYTGIQLNINNTSYPQKEEVVEYRSQNRIPIEKTIPTENTIMEALNKLNAKLPFMKDRIYNTTTKGLDFESNLKRVIESVDKIVGEYIQDKEIRMGIYTHIINNKIKQFVY